MISDADPVACLRNVGPTLVAALQAVHIHTVGQLRAVGSVAAYQRMQAAHPDRVLPVRHYLYALEAGLMHLCTADLPMRHRIRLYRAARDLCQDLPANEARPARVIRARGGRRRRARR